MTAVQSRQTPLTCSGHTRPVVDLAYSPLTDDGPFLISSCKDGQPILRNGVTGDWVGTFKGHKGAVWCARLDRKASKAVTGSADFTAYTKVWSAVSGECLKTFAHKHIVRACDFSPDATHIVTGGHEKIIRVYTLEGEEAQTPEEIGQCDGLIRVLLWPTANQIISASDDGFVRCWDVTTKQKTHEFTANGPIHTITQSCPSNGSPTLVVTSGKMVHLLRADTLDLIKSHTLPYAISSAALHPEGHLMVVGAKDDLWVRLIDATTATEIKIEKGHHGPVHTVSFSPDGELYATGSEDGTIRLWQTTPGKPYGLWQPNEAIPQEA